MTFPLPPSEPPADHLDPAAPPGPTDLAPALPPYPDPDPTAPRLSRREVVESLVLIVVMAAVGALLGVIWAHFAPDRPLGYVIKPGAIIPDETESFISTDARFAIYTGIVGIAFGIIAWTRRRARGPVMALAVVVGGLAGAVLTDVVGRALGGGKADGAANSVIRLQLEVHAAQLLCIEGFFAVAVYATATLFSDQSDLGRALPTAPELTPVAVGGPAGPVHEAGPVREEVPVQRKCRFEEVPVNAEEVPRPGP